MAQTTRFAAIAGMAAALSMAATPAVAAEHSANTGSAGFPFATPVVFDKDAMNADRYRRWHRRNRVDAGDVLAGVLILGGIAAVASAASKADRRERDYRYRDYRYPDRPYDYRERRGDSRNDAGRGIDNAVDMCVSRIERDVRVESVDEVDRTGEGWSVSGSLYNGERFTCRIGPDGRVEDVDFGGYAANDAGDDRQWSDDRYRAAWADVESGKAVVPEQGAQDEAQRPAYPGGPIGDEAEDDRYSMAQPD